MTYVITPTEPFNIANESATGSVSIGQFIRLSNSKTGAFCNRLENKKAAPVSRGGLCVFHVLDSSSSRLSGSSAYPALIGSALPRRRFISR